MLTDLASLIGLLMAIAGCVCFLCPNNLRRITASCQKAKRLYTAGIIRTICGIIFILASSASKSVMIVRTAGALILLNGMLIFALGPRRIKPAVDWIRKKPDIFLRLFSLIFMAVGILLIQSI